MKLPRLIKTTQQLRKILRQGPIENLTSWDCLGPCPEFIKGAAVEMVIGGESYVVFKRVCDLIEFHKDLMAKDEAAKDEAAKTRAAKTGAN
jgi:hypothetical protein